MSHTDNPMPPLFSIITVCYNAASTIRTTIESVDRQTCDLYEHIIIDGKSTDNTLSIINDHPNDRRSVVSEPDNGIYDAMNKGLGRAKGEYVIFLNAGDSFHNENILQILADTAMNYDFPGIMYGQTQLVDISGQSVGPRHLTAPSVLTYKSFANGMLVCHQAFVPLRRITGLYDTKYKLSADFDWCIRCLQHSRHNQYVDRILIDYLNEGMTTANNRKSLFERFRIMCYYYGYWSAIMHHISFIPRYIKRLYKQK